MTYAVLEAKALSEFRDLIRATKDEIVAVLDVGGNEGFHFIIVIKKI